MENEIEKLKAHIEFLNRIIELNEATISKALETNRLLLVELKKRAI